MAKISGRKEILKNLKKQGNLLRRGVSAGVIDVSTTVENFSNRLAPRDTNFLRISSFIVDKPNQTKDLTIGRVGYTSAYAAFVHEMPKYYNFTTPETGPKFLERSVTGNTSRLTKTFFNTVARFVAAWR